MIGLLAFVATFGIGLAGVVVAVENSRAPNQYQESKDHAFRLYEKLRRRGVPKEVAYVYYLAAIKDYDEEIKP